MAIRYFFAVSQDLKFMEKKALTRHNPNLINRKMANTWTLFFGLLDFI
jgi:hypothetical protein